VDADTSVHDGQFYMCDVGSTIAGEASGHFLQFWEMSPDSLSRVPWQQGILEEEMEQMHSSRIPWWQGILEEEDPWKQGTLEEGMEKMGWLWRKKIEECKRQVFKF